MRKILASILTLIFLMVLLSFPSEAYATSKYKEKEAFKKKLPSIYQQVKMDSYLPTTQVKYTFLDINKDGVMEMLVYDSLNPYSKGYIYTYNKGRVKLALTKFSYQPSRNIDILYYQKGNVLKCSYISEHESYTYIYKYKNGKFVKAAEIMSDEISNKTYKIAGKKVSKKAYDKNLRKMVKGSKAKKAKGLKWYTY